ncbi:MAG: PmbA/TldA family metallopeptidase [Dehalococcoidia bacterium]
MRDRLTDALKGLDADYVEIRFEDSHHTSIVYKGRSLEEMSRARNSGGSIRALVRGSWGFVSFDRLDGLADRAALAVQEARLAGDESFTLSPTEPVVDTVTAQIKNDASAIPLAVKKGLLDEYNDVILSSP